MEIFMEYIIRKRQDYRDYLIIAGIILATVIVLLAVMLFLIVYLGSFTLLIMAAAVYGAYVAISSRNVEFEYAVTNGELDIDRIMARRKRKRLLSVHCRSFEILVPADSAEHSAELNSPSINKKIEAASSVDSPNAYCAIFQREGERVRLTFEPTRAMLDAFKTFIPRKIVYREEDKR